MGAPQHIVDASTLYNNTLLYALYGPDLDNVFVSAINISFGQTMFQSLFDIDNHIVTNSLVLYQILHQYEILKAI